MHQKKEKERRVNERFKYLIRSRAAIVSVSVQELGQTVQCSLPVVLNYLVRALFVQFDCREGVDFRVFQFIGSRVDLRDHDV